MSRWPEHETVDRALRLDVRELARDRDFRACGSWSGARSEGWSWALAGGLFVELAAEERSDGLDDPADEAGEATGLGDETLLQLTHGGRSYMVAVEFEPCHLGGVRPRFRCPAAGCDRRCAVLHLGGGNLYACRKCQGLTYQSQREGPAARAFRRRNRILMRARCEAGPAACASKPPRMWWRTFLRLQARAQQAEDEAMAVGLVSLERDVLALEIAVAAVATNADRPRPAPSDQGGKDTRRGAAPADAGDRKVRVRRSGLFREAARRRQARRV